MITDRHRVETDIIHRVNDDVPMAKARYRRSLEHVASRKDYGRRFPSFQKQKITQPGDTGFVALGE